MIRACIFDLDGTLADTLESIAWVANRVLEDLGLPAQETERFKTFAGDGGRALMERCLQASGGSLELLDRAEQAYRAEFAAHPMFRTGPYPGIPELLEHLKARGLLLAVCSNKPHAAAVQVVEGLFGPGCFDAVLGQSPERPRKPAPDMPLALAEKLGVRPEECLYLGDTNTDMDTGRNAGMHPVGVLWGFRDRAELEAHGAEFLIECPEEVEDCLAFLESKTEM